ncbi:hypothetical protein [Bifidobacterium cuniculi]|uniref:Transcriptional regulator n=1 Tax=Bifidobacterium cuniculi TaxID=1688 RepID=A0A087B3Y8_9BIFI|nr:hypothetical protein [Bifidobacterium cuniculi]KFI65738.1 hypothetical protein BCUN_0233 [Bifidobacterium cuniculi]
MYANDNKTLRIMEEVCEALVYAENPMTKQELSETIPTQPNSHRIIPAVYLLQAANVIVRTSGRGTAKYRLKVQFPDELLPAPNTETAEEYRQELADALRELADWVEESLPE